MDNLKPITNEEILMNGDELEPYTRREKILAGVYVEPPYTRIEKFLMKYRHAGGDVTVEGLSVTANGTYTAPEGKAYSPVEVAVPLPENAYLLKTASGSLVSFSDGADLPMPSFVCNIDAVQSGSGEPSPENVRPISGHTGVDAWVRGKNLANPATVTTLYPTGDSGTYPNQIRSSSNARSVIAEVTPNTTYTISKKAGQRFRLAFTAEVPANGVADMEYEWNDTGTTITVTSPSNAKYMVALFWSANADTDTEEDMLATLQIEIGETATTYEPYNSASQTIQVSWQTEAGEVYGGYVDLVSGVLTVDRYCESFNGSENWEQESVDNCYSIKLRGTLAKWEWNTFGMCNLYQYNGTVSGASNMNNEGLYYWFNSAILTPPNNRYAMIRDNTKSTLEEFKTYLSTNNLQVVYELETPITYQLTPQQIKSLLGENNVWCDTGDVDIDYFAKEVTG